MIHLRASLILLVPAFLCGRSLAQAMKAVPYNFACHAANTRDLSVSADFPDVVQQYVDEHAGRAVPTLFLAGACGDVNPISSVPQEVFAEKIGGEIIEREAVDLLKRLKTAASTP